MTIIVKHFIVRVPAGRPRTNPLLGVCVSRLYSDPYFSWGNLCHHQRGKGKLILIRPSGASRFKDSTPAADFLGK